MAANKIHRNVIRFVNLFQSRENLDIHEPIYGLVQHTFNSFTMRTFKSVPLELIEALLGMRWRRNGRLSRNLINFKWIFYFNFCDFESSDGGARRRTQREDFENFCFPRRIAGIKITHSSSTENFTKTRFLFFALWMEGTRRQPTLTPIITWIRCLKPESVWRVSLLMEFKFTGDLSRWSE